MSEAELDKRRLIIDAMVELVVASSFEEVSISEVLKRAGASQEDFDRHFADKQDLYVVAHQTVFIDPLEECLFRRYEEFDDWREGLRAAAYGSARYIRDNPRDAQFGSVAMFSAGLMAQTHREAHLQRVVDLIHAGRWELDDPDSVDRSVAEAALGAVYVLSIREIRAGGTDRIERFVPELMYLAVRPYVGEEEAKKELTYPPPPE